MAKKTTKKSTKPAFTVNLDNIQCLDDIDVAFGLAKQQAGLPIRDYELIAIVEDVVKHVTPKITIIDCSECKLKCRKTPWYKRFWRWLTHKK